jgi:hypothetical protein
MPRDGKTAPRSEAKGDFRSMPSSHAANWFAATMILFIYYRRSAWLMLTGAILVSFSRIYNGVHYPSDVAAGAILGAGYAAASVWSTRSGRPGKLVSALVEIPFSDRPVGGPGRQVTTFFFAPPPGRIPPWRAAVPGWQAVPASGRTGPPV